MKEIPQEEINYFKNLERRFRNKYNDMTEREREDFDLYVLENAGDWLKLGGFTRKSKEDKSYFVEFMEMFSLIEAKPDDDTTDPSYIYRLINLAIDYVEYMKSKVKKTKEKK